jgi:hypothetical protein
MEGAYHFPIEYIKKERKGIEVVGSVVGEKLAGLLKESSGVVVHVQVVKVVI